MSAQSLTRCAGISLVVIAASLAVAVGQAQTFPSKAISVIVGTAPGDPGDIVARLIQNRMVERLGQPWVVENRPGAAGRAAAQTVARAAPDGHNLLVTLSSHVISPASITELPYDAVRDFAGVTLVARQPLIIAVHPSVEGASLKEFIAAAKANPSSKLSYSSPGTGTLSFLVGEQIVRGTGIEMPHVPFRGGSPAAQALLTNEVQFCALIPAILLPHIRSGAIRALAVTSDARMPELPDVPTLKELGYDFPATYNWIGFFAPSATPRPVIDRLNAEITSALREPALMKWFADTGFQPVASTPAELDGFVVSEVARWRKFAKDYNVRFE